MSQGFTSFVHSLPLLPLGSFNPHSPANACTWAGEAWQGLTFLDTVALLAQWVASVFLAVAVSLPLDLLASSQLVIPLLL